MPLRIRDVREITQSIVSPIRNAYIDFSGMVTSLVAVVMNAERDASGSSAMDSTPMDATAVWDAVTKIASGSLVQRLAGRHYPVAGPLIFVYTAGGHDR